MANVTGEYRVLRASAVFAANATYYACTENIRSFYGGDRLRLDVSVVDADAGTVTFKCERLLGDKVTWSDMGGDLISVVLADGETKSVTIPVGFIGNDVVRVSFKASAGATTSKILIAGLFFESGQEVLQSGLGGTISTPVATTTDGTLSMVAGTASDISFTGTGFNYQVQLPPANALTLMERRVFANYSSEAVIVRNSDSTFMVWLMPWETLVATCIGVADAAGVWAGGIASGMLKQRWFDDMLEAAGGASSGSWRPYADTGANGFSSTFTSNQQNRCGLANLATGTTSTTAWALSRQASMIDLGGVSVMLSASMSLITGIQTAAEDFKVEFGLMTKTNGDDETDGVWIDVPSIGAGATPKWRGNTATTAGGASAPVEGAVDVDTGWNTPRIIVSSDGARVDFWINRTYIGKIEGNAPLAANSLTSMFRIKKSAGNVNRQISVDWFEIAYARDVR